MGEAFSGEAQHEKSLAYFTRSLAIRKDLVLLSDNVGSQRDFTALTYERVADEQYALGHYDEARESYQTAFQIRETLASASDTRELQYDLSVSYDRLARIAAGREEAIQTL